MSGEARVLVCERLSAMPKPPVRSRTGFCDRCGAHVWVAESSPPADFLWCCQCAAMEIDGDDEAEPMTEEQIGDVLDYLYRRGMS